MSLLLAKIVLRKDREFWPSVPVKFTLDKSVLDEILSFLNALLCRKTFDIDGEWIEDIVLYIKIIRFATQIGSMNHVSAHLESISQILTAVDSPADDRILSEFCDMCLSLFESKKILKSIVLNLENLRSSSLSQYSRLQEKLFQVMIDQFRKLLSSSSENHLILIKMILIVCSGILRTKDKATNEEVFPRCIVLMNTTVLRETDGCEVICMKSILLVCIWNYLHICSFSGLSPRGPSDQDYAVDLAISISSVVGECSRFYDTNHSLIGSIFEKRNLLDLLIWNIGYFCALDLLHQNPGKTHKHAFSWQFLLSNLIICVFETTHFSQNVAIAIMDMINSLLSSVCRRTKFAVEFQTWLNECNIAELLLSSAGLFRESEDGAINKVSRLILDFVSTVFLVDPSWAVDLLIRAQIFDDHELRLQIWIVLYSFFQSDPETINALYMNNQTFLVTCSDVLSRIEKTDQQGKHVFVGILETYFKNDKKCSWALHKCNYFFEKLIKTFWSDERKNCLSLLTTVLINLLEDKAHFSLRKDTILQLIQMLLNQIRLDKDDNSVLDVLTILVDVCENQTAKDFASLLLNQFELLKQCSLFVESFPDNTRMVIQVFRLIIKTLPDRPEEEHAEYILDCCYNTHTFNSSEIVDEMAKIVSSKNCTVLILVLLKKYSADKLFWKNLAEQLCLQIISNQFIPEEIHVQLFATILSVFEEQSSFGIIKSLLNVTCSPSLAYLTLSHMEKSEYSPDYVKYFSSMLWDLSDDARSYMTIDEPISYEFQSSGFTLMTVFRSPVGAGEYILACFDGIQLLLRGTLLILNSSIRNTIANLDPDKYHFLSLCVRSSNNRKCQINININGKDCFELELEIKGLSKKAKIGDDSAADFRFSWASLIDNIVSNKEAYNVFSFYKINDFRLPMESLKSLATNVIILSPLVKDGCVGFPAKLERISGFRVVKATSLESSLRMIDPSFIQKTLTRIVDNEKGLIIECVKILLKVKCEVKFLLDFLTSIAPLLSLHEYKIIKSFSADYPVIDDALNLELCKSTSTEVIVEILQSLQETYEFKPSRVHFTEICSVFLENDLQNLSKFFEKLNILFKISLRKNFDPESLLLLFELFPTTHCVMALSNIEENIATRPDKLLIWKQLDASQSILPLIGHSDEQVAHLSIQILILDSFPSYYLLVAILNSLRFRLSTDLIRCLFLQLEKSEKPSLDLFLLAKLAIKYDFNYSQLFLKLVIESASTEEKCLERLNDTHWVPLFLAFEENQVQICESLISLFEQAYRLNCKWELVFERLFIVCYHAEISQCQHFLSLFFFKLFEFLCNTQTRGSLAFMVFFCFTLGLFLQGFQILHSIN